MTLYDPAFLPEESDDLLDFFDLEDENKEVVTQAFSGSLADLAYEHDLGEMQLRDMIKKSADGKTITLNGKVIEIR